MSNVLYYPNLRASGLRPTSTGTEVTDSGAEVHACLDVFARNSVADPLFVTAVAATLSVVRETRFHDTSSVAINDSAGAFVEIGTGGYAAVIGATPITSIQINCSFGEPVTIRKAASAVAAAAAVDLCILNRGEQETFGVSILTGERIWVRSLTSVAVSSGILTVNLAG